MSYQNLRSFSIFYKNPNYFCSGFPKYAAIGGKLNIGEKKVGKVKKFHLHGLSQVFLEKNPSILMEHLLRLKPVANLESNFKKASFPKNLHNISYHLI